MIQCWLDFDFDFRKRQAKMQKELEEAAKDTRGLSPETMKDNGSAFFTNALPTNATIKFVSIPGVHFIVVMAFLYA